MTKRSNSFYIKILVLLELILIFICVFQSMVHEIRPNTRIVEDSIDMTKGWYDKEGNAVVLEPLLSNKNIKFGKKTSIFYDLDDKIKPGDSLCFRSLSTKFEAYIDDKLIVKPTYYKSRFSCESTGSQWHFYTFQEEDMGKTIEIKLEFFYNDNASYFENMMACKASDYIINAIVNKASEIIVALFIIAIGIFIAIVGVYSKYNLNLSQNLLITLGLFACTLGMWTLLESHIIELLFNVSQYVQIMACNMLLLLPLSMILLLANIFESKQYKLVNRTSLFCTLIFVTTWILQLTGIQDFHDSLYLAFVSVIAAGLMSVVMAILDNKQILFRGKKISVTSIAKRQNYFKLYGYIGFFVCILVDFIGFYINPQKINGMFSRWSTLYAIGICIFIAIKNIVTISEEYMHATAIGKVAYNDVLTGLANRTAYTEKINEINELEKRPTTVGIVMFDVNDLKNVNDNLGHNYGDELIMAASQVIKESFDDSVTVYRIGGDEFLGIIESNNAKQIYKLASIQFKTLVHNYNITYHKPFYLSIAIGEAFLEVDSEKDISEIIEEADKRMYKDKQEYKKTHRKNNV